MLGKNVEFFSNPRSLKSSKNVQMNIRVSSSKNWLNYTDLWYWNYENIEQMKYFNQKISLKKCKMGEILAEQK